LSIFSAGIGYGNTRDRMPEQIAVFGGDYEFTLEVSGEHHGLAVDYRPVGVATSFGTILRKQPFQACEFSLANYLMMLDRGDTRMTATPIFLNRAFRHGVVLVRKDSPIKSFAELRGKRVGAREYSQTAAVWLRGLLRDDYKVDWRDIRWYCGTEQRFPPPSEATVDRGDDDPEELLIAGKLDALVAVITKDSHKPAGQRELRPLLPDSDAAERDYYKRTGIYPLNHTVVIERGLARAHPAVGQAIYDAYESGKAKALKRKLGSTLMPWGAQRWDDAMTLFRGDPMPYGLTDANRAQIETLIGYVHEQGLISRRPKVDEIFEPGAAHFHLNGPKS
jgi:4,5-dihydroxyphthalate decarboxylase